MGTVPTQTISSRRWTSSTTDASPPALLLEQWEEASNKQTSTDWCQRGGKPRRCSSCRLVHEDALSLNCSRYGGNKRNRNSGEFIVNGCPAHQQERLEVATSLPGAVTAADPGPDARAIVQSALTE